MTSLLVSSILKATTTCLSVIRSTPSTSSISTTAAQDLERLKRLLERIQKVLQDAEEREINEKSVKHWLKEIKELSYDAEDVLDEYQYRVSQAEVENRAVAAAEASTKWKGKEEVMALASPPNFDGRKISILSSMAERIKNIINKFEEISQDRERLHLRDGDGEKRHIPKYPPPTSHMVNEHDIHGRNVDKKKLIRWLLSDKASKIDVLAVVGMGGLGKTTLAQLVYNDPEVSRHFQRKIWICVSDEFDLVRLTRAMVESLTGEKCKLAELSLLQGCLHENLLGLRILLVLDDVWNENKDLWRSLIIPFDGAETVSIIVTTRNEPVAAVMKATEAHRLGYLPEEECWELFKCHAFDGRDPKEFPSSLVEIGKKIVKKCGGLPLAVKSLGGLLQHEEADENKWMDVLESNLWEPDEETNNRMKNVILPALKLSYNRMPSYLRPCFAICSIFPKDYIFRRDALVNCWASLGYIQYNKFGKQSVGYEYLDELHRRSFFDEDVDKKGYFKMHDNIHDLAQYISGSTVRHLFIQHKSFELPTDAGSVRSVIVTGTMTESLAPLRNLRYLKLEPPYISPIEPFLHEEIGNFIYLRHLILDILQPIIRLPESIGHLYNLTVLDIFCRGLVKLPKTMQNLLLLEHLSLKCREFSGSKFPTWFGRNPSYFNKLTEVYFCGFFTKQLPPFGQLPSLKCLYLKSIRNLKIIGSEFCRGRNSNLLVAFPSLTQLKFKDMTDLEEWDGDVRDGDFPLLRELQVYDCRKFWSFLALRNLRFIKQLILEACPELQLRSEGSLPPNLKTLYPYEIPRVCLSLGFGNETIKLERLEGTFWVRIEEIFEILENVVNLKSLVIAGLHNVQRILKYQACIRRKHDLQRLYLQWDNFELDPYLFREEKSRNFKVFLNIIEDEKNSKEHKGGDQIENGNISFDVLENLQPHTNIERLYIQKYNCVEYPSWVGQPSFDKLIKVYLINCKNQKLPTLGRLPSLKFLELSSILSLESISEEFCRGMDNQHEVAFPSLMVLKFDDMPDWKEWDGVRLGDFPQLQKLRIYGCPKLLSIPNLQNLHRLWYLSIWNCPALKLEVCIAPNTENFLYGGRGSEVRIASMLEICLAPEGLESVGGDFRVGNDDLFEILKDLVAKPECLAITGLENVCNVYKAGDLVKVKHQFKKLALSWGASTVRHFDYFNPDLLLILSDNNLKAGETGPWKSSVLLEKLKPHTNLEQLKIEGYDGTRYASWIRDPLFNKLTEVHLVACKTDHVPTLGQLPSLKFLYMHSFPSLKRIGDEFCRRLYIGYDGTSLYKFIPCIEVAFPSLSKLQFQDMTDWQEWSGVLDGDFPKLESLVLQNCPKLSYLALRNTIQLRSQYFNKLTCLTLVSGKIDQLPTLGQLPSLDSFSLHSFSQLKRIGEEFCRPKVLPHDFKLVAFPSLRFLNFKDMIDWEEWSGVIDGDFPKLFRLEIENCPKLSSCIAIQNLRSDIQYFSIRSCPTLQISSESFPPNLKMLRHYEYGPGICLSPGGNLSKLRELDGEFGVKKDQLFRVLKDLAMNPVSLLISGLQNIPYILEENANVKVKHVNVLRLKWTTASAYPHSGLHLIVLDDKGSNNTENISFSVLDNLEPHKNLKTLYIEDYNDVAYPSWVGRPSFKQLKEVHLHGGEIEQIATLGQLPDLRSVSIAAIRRLKRVGNEFCRNKRDGDKKAFPSLIQLEWNNVPDWEEWCGVLDGDFPRLRWFRIAECPKLHTLNLPQRLLDLKNFNGEPVSRPIRFDVFGIPSFF